LLRTVAVRWYSVAARHDATGEMAGITQVTVDEEHPDWGHQGLTAVAINTALRYQVAGAPWQFYELPVSSVAPQS
jgi:hypothetical protein